MWNPLRPGIEPLLHWPGSELPGKSLPCSLDSTGFGQWLSLVGEQKIVQEWCQGNYTSSQLGHCNSACVLPSRQQLLQSIPALQHQLCTLGHRIKVGGMRVTGNALPDIANPDILQHPLLASLDNNILKVFCIKLSSIIPSEWGGYLFRQGPRLVQCALPYWSDVKQNRTVMQWTARQCSPSILLERVGFRWSW